MNLKSYKLFFLKKLEILLGVFIIDEQFPIENCVHCECGDIEIYC